MEHSVAAFCFSRTGIALALGSDKETRRGSGARAQHVVTGWADWPLRS